MRWDIGVLPHPGCQSPKRICLLHFRDQESQSKPSLATVTGAFSQVLLCILGVLYGCDAWMNQLLKADVHDVLMSGLCNNTFGKSNSHYDYHIPTSLNVRSGSNPGILRRSRPCMIHMTYVKSVHFNMFSIILFYFLPNFQSPTLFWVQHSLHLRLLWSCLTAWYSWWPVFIQDWSTKSFSVPLSCQKLWTPTSSKETWWSMFSLFLFWESNLFRERT